jgi:hypothetical protein
LDDERFALRAADVVIAAHNNRGTYDFDEAVKAAAKRHNRRDGGAVRDFVYVVDDAAYDACVAADLNVLQQADIAVGGGGGGGGGGVVDDGSYSVCAAAAGTQQYANIEAGYGHRRGADEMIFTVAMHYYKLAFTAAAVVDECPDAIESARWHGVEIGVGATASLFVLLMCIFKINAASKRREAAEDALTLATDLMSMEQRGNL